MAVPKAPHSVVLMAVLLVDTKVSHSAERWAVDLDAPPAVGMDAQWVASLAGYWGCQMEPPMAAM